MKDGRDSPPGSGNVSRAAENAIEEIEVVLRIALGAHKLGRRVPTDNRQGDGIVIHPVTDVRDKRHVPKRHIATNVPKVELSCSRRPTEISGSCHRTRMISFGQSYAEAGTNKGSA
jgi:hypothetical protein